jgi:protease-4
MRVMTALIEEPWLLSPTMHRHLTAIAMAHASGGSIESAQHQIALRYSTPAGESQAAAGNALKTAPIGQKTFAPVTPSGVAVIPVEGVIGRKFSGMLQDCGVCSIDVLDRLLEECASRPDVRGVVLDFDSPGGSSSGVEDTAAAVARLESQKPVIAFANTQMCSAAYWIGAHASAVYGLRSASVGSIGVYLALLDSSRAHEMAGYKVEAFASGPLKGIGIPGTAITDQQRAFLQARVDSLAANFKGSVCEGRGRKIADEHMQGQSIDGQAAIAAGLIDSFSTIERCIADVDALAKMRGL